MSVCSTLTEAGPEPAARSPRTGELGTALAHAARLLSRDPALALRQSQEILRAAPGSAEALCLKGRAEAALGRLAAARASLVEAGRLGPLTPLVWLALGEVCSRLGEVRASQAALLRHVEAAVSDGELIRAGAALAENQLEVAEPLLRGRLKAEPFDVVALRMLGELAARLGRYTDAEALLARAAELAPGFTAARYNHAQVLYRQGRGEAVLAAVAQLLAEAPEDPTYRLLEAGARALVGDYAESAGLYETLIARHPGQPKLWLSYAHALKTLGRSVEAVAAYRRCIALAPAMGEAWWSLANMKTVRFTAQEREALAERAARPGASDEDRLHLDYALGKALEDEGATQAAFDSYARGAAIQKRRLGYSADETTAEVERLREAYTADLLETRAGLGCPAADPIFIVGLPRSGSTLIEQILASHSQVEGTMELAEMSQTARRAGEALGGRAAYPAAIGGLSADTLAALGQGYLDGVQVQRKTSRPFFVDKMPNNWLHVGLIRLVLPNARIIDARRHPLGACFSAFKQHFARGHAFSYDLQDLGFYYRDYVALMSHFDQVAPGAVHRVIYEKMVEDTETEVRRLLDYCGLPFEPACLRFYETERAVRTASAEQVRRPIYREGLDHWKRFEGRLGPLKAALGPTLDHYPAAPA